MLETGVLLLFLVPGLAAYAAIYGLFHNGKAIAPEPPAANTVEGVVVIAGASIAVHALTSTGFAINRLLCRSGACPIEAPAAYVDTYGSALRVVSGGSITGDGVAVALIGIAAQGALTYAMCRWRLSYLARRNRLPAWIYGWARPLADALDDEGTPVLAYILTTTDHDGRAVGYGGIVNDLALRTDGCITRITLTDCERYLVDFRKPFGESSLSEPMSYFGFMAIEGTQIRNVAFEVIDLSPPHDTEPAPSSDLR